MQLHGVQISVTEGPADAGDIAIDVTVRYTVRTPFGPKLAETATTHRDVTAKLKPETLAEFHAIAARLKVLFGEQMEAVGAREAAQLHVIGSGRLATLELTGEL